MESDIKRSSKKNIEADSSMAGIEPKEAENQLGSPVAGTMTSSAKVPSPSISESIAAESGTIPPMRAESLENKTYEAKSRIKELVAKSSSFFRGIIPQTKEYFSEKERVKRAAGSIGAVAAVGGIGALAINRVKQPQQRKILRLNR